MKFHSPITYLLSTCLALTLGCLKSATSYAPPQKQVPYTASVEVNKPKDQVWKELISALGSQFFVINNLDKESGLINVSYSGDPEKYVDCGQITYDIENARGPRHYAFAGSQAIAKYETTNNNKTQIGRMTRKMGLEGRINIIVESLEPSRTKVMVNVKYILTKTIDGETLASNGGFNVAWVRLPTNVETNSFNSNQEGVFAQGGTACHPTGALEIEILGLVKR